MVATNNEPNTIRWDQDFKVSPIQFVIGVLMLDSTVQSGFYSWLRFAFVISRWCCALPIKISQKQFCSVTHSYFLFTTSLYPFFLSPGSGTPSPYHTTVINLNVGSLSSKPGSDIKLLSGKHFHFEMSKYLETERLTYLDKNLLIGNPTTNLFPCSGSIGNAHMCQRYHPPDWQSGADMGFVLSERMHRIRYALMIIVLYPGFGDNNSFFAVTHQWSWKMVEPRWAFGLYLNTGSCI